MRLLKQAAIGLIVFGIILLLISLLLPSRIRISKSVLIHAPHNKVMASLLHIEEWKNWNPILQDSSIKYTIYPPYRADWISKDAVPNSIQLEPFARDSINMVILSKNKQVFSSGFSVVSHQQDSLLTKVEWWISEDIKWYPWEKFYGLFSESFRDTYMDNTLQLLKQYIENR
ncbi:MAG: hypothetical protein M9904_12910 [Chitinophagaceae bacterium]|nr:hypothetical protein [Chitinophagaceae bacterium]